MEYLFILNAKTLNAFKCSASFLDFCSKYSDNKDLITCKFNRQGNSLSTNHPCVEPF